MIDPKCICSHFKSKHTGYYERNWDNDDDTTATACMDMEKIDGQNRITWCRCWQFKLDNLSLIEQLAEEKNLI